MLIAYQRNNIKGDSLNNPMPTINESNLEHTQQEIVVDATIELTEDSSILTLINNTPNRLLFLIAQGSPPYEFQAIKENGTITIRGQFRCGYKYVHDDFHADSIQLEPGEKKGITFSWAIPTELGQFVNKGIFNCEYRTVIKQ